MTFPALHARVGYLTINNAAKRNALSLAVLRDLKSQLLGYNLSPIDQEARFLPPFRPEILTDLERLQDTLDGDDNANEKVMERTRRNQPESSYADTEMPQTYGDDSSGNRNFDRGKNDPLQRGHDLKWLLNSRSWNHHRQGLPRILILHGSTPEPRATNGHAQGYSKPPIFSSGHDLRELSQLSHAEIKETFSLCAQVMTLIRRSPIPVVSVMGPNELATAAGAQLFLSADWCLAHKSARFQLPGQNIGLPCTSPSSIFARRLGHAATARLLFFAQPITAGELLAGGSSAGAVEVVDDDDKTLDATIDDPTRKHGHVSGNDDGDDCRPENKLEQRLSEITNQIINHSAGQPQALGKWAFWTQAGFNGTSNDNLNLQETGNPHDLQSRHGSGSGADGYEDALEWTGRVMALHARADDAREGISAFLEKRKAVWKT